MSSSEWIGYIAEREGKRKGDEEHDRNMEGEVERKKQVDGLIESVKEKKSFFPLW